VRIIGPLSTDDSSPFAAIVFFFRYGWLRYAALGALFTAVYVYARNAKESTARALQASLDRQRLDAQMDEARLQVLQAQIEPHFLFNTLATVRRLYHTTPGSAIATLDNLMHYLSVALPQMRSSESTLGREAALAESYLAIQQLRMGRRLGFDVDIPHALRAVPMPPMMLVTLIENAIKHGLASLPEGGFVRVNASTERGRLRVSVADSGRGFVGTSGAGTGLANIRARLAALYGPAGRLELQLNHPRGITATIELPVAASFHPASS
jgi:LytS/YehU family sensor histidine kinase